VTAPYAADMNALRRRLRGAPSSAVVQIVRTFLENFRAAALAADNTGRYIAANERAAALTGYSCDELLGMTVKDLTPPMRQDAVSELWPRFIQAGSQAGDYVLQRKDGTPVGVHYSAYASVGPGVHISVLTPLDVPSSI
jgi:PAS domain S-box-containing protein